MKKIINFYKSRQINVWVIFFILIYLIFIIKLITIREIDKNLFFGLYSLSVTFYILSRFLLSYFYEPRETEFRQDYQPTVTFAVPSKNEEKIIKETILRIARSDYPKDKFDVIAVNDGSNDKTLQLMYQAKELAASLGVSVKIIDWEVNRGKRHGMAECVKQSNSEIIVFIDSDSFVQPSTVKELVKYFSDERVAAVAAHGFVANDSTNILTKMQAVRYFVAFKAYKASEALFGSVTCCSGCGSAYKRKYILQVVDKWFNQTFLGVRCTYGDDRSLTNFLLEKGYKAMYAPEAKVYTYVPDTFRKFLKQQLRWKKSWIRETLKAGLFMWKKNPIMSGSFYLGAALTLLSPVIVVRAIIWHPYTSGRAPLSYLLGLFLMAVVYGLYYRIHIRDKKWVYGVLFAAFYTLVLIWQLPYAILNIRDPRWGTR